MVAQDERVKCLLRAESMTVGLISPRQADEVVYQMPGLVKQHLAEVINRAFGQDINGGRDIHGFVHRVVVMSAINLG